MVFEERNMGTTPSHHYRRSLKMATLCVRPLMFMSVLFGTLLLGIEWHSEFQARCDDDKLSDATDDQAR